uniref:CS domain-containing protein n=1 Tax=Haptolina brevifila TaxID=156173 RepID=A0A7S2D623_9EUKA
MRKARVQAIKDQQDRAERAAQDRYEEEERMRNIRRKEQTLKNREEALKLAAKLGATKDNVSDTIAKGGAEQLAKIMSLEQAREAAAAAARANPIAPKKVEAAAEMVVGSGVGKPAAVVAETTESLAKCGYWFEDASDELVKVTVPMEAACNGAPLPKEGAVSAHFTDMTFRLEVKVGTVTHVLTSGELYQRIDPKASCAKVRVKTKRVVLELAKMNKGKPWKTLSV